MTERCGAIKTVQLGNQIVQAATCHREAGHVEAGDRAHRDVVLDSDDNAITYQWTDR